MSAIADLHIGPDRSGPQTLQFDPLAHVNPLSPTFYRDAATAAAYLIHGEGRWLESGRCVLTAAIMHHAIRAARENRAPSLIEVHQILLEAGRQIRAAIPFIADQGVARAVRRMSEASKVSTLIAATISNGW